MSERWHCTLSDPLSSAADMHRIRERMTRPEYLVSVVRYSVAANVPHTVTGPIGALNGYAQDAHDRKVLEDFTAGKRTVVSKTKVRCHDIVVALFGTAAPSQEMFLSMVAERERADAEARG